MNGPGKMKKAFCISVLCLTVCLLCRGNEIPGNWQESGELEYSYAYARTVLGYRMRRDGWVCKLGFTAGKNGEQEHSVWVKGSRKMQLMIWKIDSNRTGYSKGEIRDRKDKRK